ncbi:MAG TPA: PQQ-binding-like beta-propeller repeat protein [Solirubrobacterales bacterium]|jgi:outer membrane protein assembly factor BamB|nr:PQQ-binding-like beta-propeller repeat protein [Solirubrobacterales bacterium]
MPLGRLSRTIACLLLAALAFSGCGGSGEDAATETSSRGSGYVDWPVFGRVPERTHYLPAHKRVLDPPLRQAWTINTHALIEFPPALAHGVAYAVNKYGNVKAVRLSDRKVLWERTPNPRNKGKQTDVTGPVYHEGLVFLAELGGDLVALDAASGKQVWKRDLHAHLESSPMAVGGTLYLGDDKTDVVALRASDGKLLWKFNSPDAIKASPSFHDGRIYVADYEGSMFALEADSGTPVWRTNTTKQPPFGEGGFFSSPAIAFGHVYAARDDGIVFAFDETTGKVVWSFPTGGFVYGSPAAARVPGTPPSVYIGSENGRLYALGALDGKPRWHYAVGGAIPGTATVIGHTVYSSSFETRKTLGVDARSGRKNFELGQAGYTPVVSDGRRLYLIGYYDLIGLEPTRH